MSAAGTGPAAAAARDPRLPTFLLCGAGKSGTSSLWSYLAAHPDVGMARIKEPGFFTRETGWRDGGDPAGPTQSGRFDDGLEWYLGLFDGCAGRAARGEASTVYMAASDAPELIRRVVPDARLLFILRHPVRRLESHYWQERRHGWPLPPLPEAVRQRHPRLRRFLAVSDYGRHLERFLEQFPRGQLHLFLYEELVADPEALIAAVYRAVGVDDGFRPAGLGRRHNVASAPRFPRLERLLALPLGRRAGRRVPGWLRRPLGRLRRALSRANARPTRYQPLPVEVHRALLAELEPSIATVEELLGRPLPAWREV